MTSTLSPFSIWFRQRIISPHVADLTSAPAGMGYQVTYVAERPTLKFYLGDVRDERSVASAMKDVHYYFHAAELKQVPSCEFYPMQAVRTNALGTENVLSAALAAGVERLICMGTDKAVSPINAMGISKAVMEKVMTAASRDFEGTGTVASGYANGRISIEATFHR